MTNDDNELYVSTYFITKNLNFKHENYYVVSNKSSRDYAFQEKQ